MGVGDFFLGGVVPFFRTVKEKYSQSIGLQYYFIGLQYTVSIHKRLCELLYHPI